MDDALLFAIVDYGMGNLISIKSLLNKLGHKCVITSKEAEIKTADFLILPGVGSFESAMLNIRELKLDVILKEEVIENNKPVIGICLGMQLMFSGSDESAVGGLDWFNGYFESFHQSDGALPNLHIGWNQVSNGFRQENSEWDYFYFVHKYFLKETEGIKDLWTCNYGVNFIAGFRHENIVGFQFHPEKSHRGGLELLRQIIHEIR